MQNIKMFTGRLLGCGLLLCGACVGAKSLMAVETNSPDPAMTATNTAPLAIGSQLQLFVDRYIIDSLDHVELRLQQPVKMPMAKNPVMAGAYTTVIKDGALYRAYWRERVQIRPEGERPTEIYFYAESRDGIEWDYPSLGLIELDGSKDNNAMWNGLHNFAPFLDTRPGVPAAERFKAVAGRGALQAFDSPDGIHWTPCGVKIGAARGKKEGFPYLIEKGPEVPESNVWMDSQNVVFWSEVEQLFVCYFRTRLRQEEVSKEVRAISRVTSPDFYGEWSQPVVMEANLPGEDLYTSQTQPYFRAPHIYVATPTRLVGAKPGIPFPITLTEVLFMSSRPGSSKYDRLFKEAFIRPGLDPVRWGSTKDDRANYVANNVVPTGPAEMSIYHKSGHRYVLRTDGFVAVHAGAEPGELLTKYFTFKGGNLLLNYSTAASGNVKVEIQDSTGKPIPGFGLQDGSMISGDAIEQAVQWKKDSDLGALAGRTIRLRFVMADADLFSFCFR